MSKTPRSDIADAIVAQLQSGKDGAVLAREIAGYLIEQGREVDLESIMRDVMTKRQNGGLVEADIQTAHGLDQSTLVDIIGLVHAEFPSATTVVADQSVDESLIGGLRISTAHEQLDLSVRGKLDTFKRLTNRGITS